MFRKNLSIALLALSTGWAAHSAPAVFPIIAGGSGDTGFDYIDRSQIAVSEIDFSKMTQKQDQEAYLKADREAQEAFNALYGSCSGDSYATCTGFRRLQEASNETFTGNTKAFIEAGEHNKAVNKFTEGYRKFEQKIAAIEVLADVWGNIANADEKSDQHTIYKKGSLNLKAFGNVYRDGIAKILEDAKNLQYTINLNGMPFTSQPGDGLNNFKAARTPDLIQAEIEAQQQHLRFTPEEQEKRDGMNLSLAQQVAQFLNTESIRLYWMNGLQKGQKEKWIQDIERQSQVLSWIRAGLCMPVGVIALDIPKPAKFNIPDMLKRGGKHVRVVRDVESDRHNIQDMLFRFDNFYVNIKSQSGEYNEEGGVMGYLHRLNSTLTWHNEVAAYMSMMKVLRDQMVEELDLISDMADGCTKVRARYQEKYGEGPLSKSSKAKKLVSGYLRKGNLTQDQANKAFVNGLTPVMAKAKYRIQIEKLKRENPAVKDAVEEVFEDLEALGTLFE